MKKYFILAAVAATFAACSFDKDMGESSSQVQEERIPLSIGYSMGVVNQPNITRGNFNDVQSDAILNDGTNNNALGVFVLKKGQNTHTSTEAYERFNVTSTSLTSNNPASKLSLINITGTDALVYPENKGQEIDIYAYAPFTTGTITDIGSDVIAINTKIDQTSKANYMASDVLWGCAGTGTNIATAKTGPYTDLGLAAEANENAITATNYLDVIKNTASLSTGRVASSAYYLTTGTPNVANVVVPMLHRGSKIVVNVLASGMIKDKLKNATVKFNVDYTTGQLNVSTGEYKVPDGTAAPGSATSITLTDHLGIDAQGASPNPEGVVTVTNTDDAFTCSAVIVPQTIAVTNDSGNGNIIEIELKSSTESSATTTATYAYKLGTTLGSTDPQFVSGKVYTYNITVTASGLSVTTSVSDWVNGTDTLPGGNGNGTADLTDA